MDFLVDHNLRGQSVILAGGLAASGWLDLISIRFVLFEEVGLEETSDDRTVWRCAQENRMILLTANRSMKGKEFVGTSDARRKYSEFPACRHYREYQSAPF